MTQPDIPEDQLDRIEPIVDELRAKLGRLVADLPLLTESALAFRAEGEAAQ